MTYVEKWESTQGRAEVHYFKDDAEEYLFGYNPQLIPDALFEPVLIYIKTMNDLKLDLKPE